MSKINFVGFGGLNERNKPCYALTINGSIYLFDCGISTPPNTQLGIQKIVPDFTWIINNANSIKGIFIGTPEYMSFAGLPYLIKHLPNVPIFCSDVGATIIINYFNHIIQASKEGSYKLPNIKILSPLVSKHIGNIIVTPFYISNNLPKSFGFIIGTPDGSIIFIDNFMISSNRNAAFEDQIFQINRLTHGRNLVLITGIGNVSKNYGFTNPAHRTVDFFNNILSENQDHRILIACHDYDLYTIMTIASCCISRNRPFLIYSGSTNKTFQYLIKNRYFTNGNRIRTFKHTEMMNQANAIIVLTGTPQRIISKIEDIIAGEDPLLKILPTDYFVYAIHTINGYERAEAEMFDHIVRTSAAKVIKLPKEVLLAQASGEDHKFLIDLLRPKYAIPINGLFMDFIKYRNIVTRSFISKNNVIMLNNGEQIEIMNGELQFKRNPIKLQLQFVNSTGTVDTGSASLYERETMATNGVVVVDLLIDKAHKKIANANLQPIGVINTANPESAAIMKSIHEICLKSLNDYLKINIKDVNEPLNTNEFKYYINKVFTRHYSKKLDKEPLIVSSLIFKKSKEEQEK